LAGCLLLAEPAQAQTDADSAKLEQLPQHFSAAWAAHDGTRLARLMAEDVAL
jgi:ketosteroid isomerase-like protein